MITSLHSGCIGAMLAQAGYILLISAVGMLILDPLFTFLQHSVPQFLSQLHGWEITSGSKKIAEIYFIVYTNQTTQYSLIFVSVYRE